MGNRIAARLDQLRWTQADLAHKIRAIDGTTDSGKVSRWITGQMPGVESILDLSHVLGVPWEWLLVDAEGAKRIQAVLGNLPSVEHVEPLPRAPDRSRAAGARGLRNGAKKQTARRGSAARSNPARAASDGAGNASEHQAAPDR